MSDLPIMLRVAGCRCVVVGGGRVAQRRATALLQAGAAVTVIAPRVTDELATLSVDLQQRNYQAGDLDGARLVVVATDNPAVNQQVHDDAQASGVLINRADQPGLGDLVVPAHARHGPVTLAVHTGGISAGAAAAIRRELSASLNPDWPRLLEVVAPYRQAIIQATEPGGRRTGLLGRLTDQTAMAKLRQGGQAALTEHCKNLLAAAKQPTTNE